MYNLVMYGSGKLTEHQSDAYQKWLIWRKFKLLPRSYTDDKKVYWNDLVDFACLDEYVAAKEEQERRDKESQQRLAAK